MAYFRKLKSGWQYRISYKDGNAYREMSKRGFKTKSEAKIAAAEMETRLKHGDQVDKSSIPFPVYMRTWFEVFRKGKKSLRNDEDIERAVKFAEDNFAGVKLKELDRGLYQKALNKYAKGHSTNSVSKRHIYMKACLQEAIQEGIIYRDPTFKAVVAGTKKEKEEELKYISFGQAQKVSNYFLSRLDNFDFISRYMILFGLATGCRLGEVLALTWDCVHIVKDEDGNPVSGTVRIKRSWDYHKKANRFIPTKNEASRRVLPIDKTTCEWLDRLHAQQSAFFMKTGLLEQWKKTPFVFVNKRLEHITDNGVNKALRLACEKVGCTKITFHGLRHTFASILLYRKMTATYVSRRLGHADIGTTLRIYTHVLDEVAQRDNENTDAIMQDLFQPPAPNVVPIKNASK